MICLQCEVLGGWFPCACFLSSVSVVMLEAVFFCTFFVLRLYSLLVMAVECHDIGATAGGCSILRRTFCQSDCGVQVSPLKISLLYLLVTVRMHVLALSSCSVVTNSPSSWVGFFTICFCTFRVWWCVCFLLVLSYVCVYVVQLLVRGFCSRSRSTSHPWFRPFICILRHVHRIWRYIFCFGQWCADTDRNSLPEWILGRSGAYQRDF